MQYVFSTFFPEKLTPYRFHDTGFFVFILYFFSKNVLIFAVFDCIFCRFLFYNFNSFFKGFTRTIQHTRFIAQKIICLGVLIA